MLAGNVLPVQLPVLVFLGGVVGFAIGAATRVLAARLHPETAVPAGWCEYPAVVLWSATAACAHLIPSWWLPPVLLLVTLAVPLTAIDLRHRRLPDFLTLPAIPLALLLLTYAAIAGPGLTLLRDAVIGSLAFAGFHALAHYLSPSALGFGDVKLSLSLGAMLGAAGPWALLLAPGIAAIITLTLYPGWGRSIPHGPGLLAATYALVLPAYL
ncbi:prepilin peptidase [Actinokineospora auranticolor]|uniref:Leader peptidase (Prepilin peptidase)/N-methyltransferase n=1 Tax=Actinokineospora auranticolor TaxID=155976 RepID=A0A2S6GFC7_9PSEU|nr:prepilin peptidase [Actinokineospora auranticolor]PPK63917.1 leader peptidase (prepilin peptidase)/N-methyltransferase [Actinokineospora auranticolor]